jgi:HD superfamily phosphohydrolase YqeK
VQPAELLEHAAAGRLPDWAAVSPRRLAHIERVAALMADWAAQLKLPPAEAARWSAAAYLHDALRDEPHDDLRSTVPVSLRDLPGSLLHGPAAAERLRRTGVSDEPLLRAIAFHTVGHPDLDRLGRALYIADFTEPGRSYQPVRLAALRARMPHALDDVLRDVVRMRIAHLLDEGRPMRAETAAFWNAIHADPHSADAVLSH